MGSYASCRTFELFNNALHMILENKCQVSYVWNLLDDFVVCGRPDSAACTERLKCVLDLAKSLGVGPTNQSFKDSSTHNLFNSGGIEVDTDTDTIQLRLPEEKLLHARYLCQQFRVKRKVTLMHLQSLIGFLNFACNLVVPSRAFLRRLIDLTKGVSSKHFHIWLTIESRRDIDAWLVFLQNFHGVSMLLYDVWLSSDKVRLYTDSATSAGYAAAYGQIWYNCSWQGYHITVLELYPIVAGVCVWGHLLANHCVLLMCDNMSVVEIINKLSSKDQHVMSLMRRFVIETMKYNILFKCKHAPGKANIVADYLSRFQVAQARESQPLLHATPVQLPWTLQ